MTPTLQHWSSAPTLQRQIHGLLTGRVSDKTNLQTVLVVTSSQVNINANKQFMILFGKLTELPLAYALCHQHGN